MKRRPSIAIWLVFAWLLLCCLASAVLLAFSSLRLMAAALLLFVLCGAIGVLSGDS